MSIVSPYNSQLTLSSLIKGEGQWEWVYVCAVEVYIFAI